MIVFVLFKVLVVCLVNIVGPKQEEHLVRQFCQYRHYCLGRGGEGGCWSPVLTRLLVKISENSN